MWCTFSAISVRTPYRWAQVITSLMAAGMQLTAIEEHDSVPWNPLGDAMEEVGGGEYRLRHDAARLAASYTLRAIKSVNGGR